MKKLTLVLLLCCLIAMPTQAEIRDHLAVDYDLLNCDWNWTVHLEKQVLKGLYVGAEMVTFSPDFGYKLVIPAWMPYRLDYDVWAEYRFREWSIRLSSWCDHWFAQSGVDRQEDKHGLTVRLRYEF